MKWQDITYWNARAYGSAMKIKRSWLMAAFAVLCMVTPGTNWMIPFSGKIIKTGIIWRY